MSVGWEDLRNEGKTTGVSVKVKMSGGVMGASTCVVAFRELRDKPVGSGLHRSSCDFLHGRLLDQAIGNIFFKASSKQQRLLSHSSHLGQNTVQSHRTRNTGVWSSRD